VADAFGNFSTGEQNRSRLRSRQRCHDSRELCAVRFQLFDLVARIAELHRGPGEQRDRYRGRGGHPPLEIRRRGFFFSSTTPNLNRA
jgi:hypothetical protein